LRPVFDALMADLKRSTELFTTKRERLFRTLASAKQNRILPGAGARRSTVRRKSLTRCCLHLRAGTVHQYAEGILKGFTGILQVDGCASSATMAGSKRGYTF